MDLIDRGRAYSVTFVRTPGFFTDRDGAHAERAFLDRWLKRRAARARRDEVLLGTLGTDGAPEIELLKQRFRGSFSEAFRVGRAGSRAAEASCKARMR